MSGWSFNWKDEDPVALILFVFIAIALLLFPWQDFDPTEDLKMGAKPEVVADAAPEATK